MQRRLNINHTLIFWLFTVLFISTVNSQSYFNTYQDIISNSAVLTSEKDVDSILNRCTKEKLFVDKAKIARDYSLQLFRKKHLDKGLKYALIDVFVYEKDLKLNNDKYCFALYKLGKFYNALGDLKRAKKTYTQIIDLNLNAQKTGQSYCELGNYYFQLGDFYNAAEYYKKGLNILKLENKLGLYANKSLDLLQVYEQINTTESLNSKLKLLQTLENQHKDYPLRESEYYYLLNEYANYYDNSETFNFEKASYYYHKALKKATLNNHQKYFKTLYTNLGSLFVTTKSDSAIYYLKKGLEYQENAYDIARNKNLTSDYYLQKGEYKNALKNAHESLIASAKISSDLNTIPESSQLKKATDKQVLLWALLKKSVSYIEIGIQEHKKTNIERALKNLETADYLIDIIQQTNFKNTSDLYWREEASKIYSKAILCCSLLEKPELAFYFTEKSKALLLTESIINNTSKNRLPEDVILRELRLKEHVLFLQDKAKIQNTALSKLNDSLFKANFAYTKYIDSIQSIYPYYNNTEISDDIFSLKKIQDVLKINDFVISYNWDLSDETQSTLHGIGLSKKTIVQFSLKNSSQLKTLLTDYKALISKPLNTKSELEHFKNISNTLYLLLFQSTDLEKHIKDKIITIIPDGELHNIPFEALLNNKGHYLIETHELSYAYSMSFLMHNQSIKRNAKRNFIGFAPISFTTQGLHTLKQTEEELKAIKYNIDGDLFLSDKATKENFIQGMSNSKVIHLATHANASKDPWIAFHDKKLKLHELYTLKNNAELAVLSACETAQGKVQIGEGVMSLARGFFYSGANSVVSSLWNVNDKSTSSIMASFYKNLKDGNSKSEALRNAKLEYIQTHSLSENSPYYWSSFILIGDSGALPMKQNNTLLFFFIFSLTLLIVFYFIYSKKSKF